MAESSTQERFKRGAADAGRFFDYIADFVGFTEEDAATIRETRFIIEKYIPSMIGGFYTRLLRFPETRRIFQKNDGTIDQEYLELRMHHQALFWRRAASGNYDEDFARFVDYVGRSHTSHGADPNIYIPERYVIGMISFVQQSINEALDAELHEIDHELSVRASKAWNALLMVILEMLSRSYTQEPGEAALGESQEIDDKAVFNLAVETYERDLGMARKIETREIFVAPADEIPEGGRKLVEVDGLSIGVFHHKGKWIALRNSCLHRGGPVCTGTLDGDTLTCPWHGYQYDVRDGHLYLDPSAHLARYPVEVREDGVYLRVDFLVRDEFEFSLEGLELPGEAAPAVPTLDENEFLLDQLSPGEVMELFIDGDPVAVSNVDGEYFAISGKCTHAGGPLGEGRLEGKTLICPWHDSCFDVTTGAATCGPARKPVKTYQVRIDAGKGIVLTGNGETNRAG